MDRDELLLCELQAKTFELSIDLIDSSSEIFIRRFMYSDISKLFDNKSILDMNMNENMIIESINKEYGYSNYGRVKYNKEEMYWIGYIYRYYVYSYNISSLTAYRIIKPKELRDLYLAYHTLSPSQAIERILESKGLLLDEEAELKRQYKIFSTHHSPHT